MDAKQLLSDFDKVFSSHRDRLSLSMQRIDRACELVYSTVCNCKSSLRDTDYTRISDVTVCVTEQ